MNRGRLFSVLGICVVLASAFLISKRVVIQAQNAPTKFTPPNAKQRTAAIGSMRNVPRDLRSAFDPADHFDPIPDPGPSDWLSQHQEFGQTFAQFQQGYPNRPDQKRNRLYFQPLGDFPKESSPSLETLSAFAEAFFQLPVEILPTEQVDASAIKSRDRGGQPRQLLSTDVLRWLETRLPDDAYCLLAITMEDLYPKESWNFVFGQASLKNRTGVYSFVRYSPEFNGQKASDTVSPLFLMRSCKVLAHETGHMFGIKHCVHFHCLMNGSNHLAESDAHPIHLCPVCLRKLQSSAKFDVRARYKSLLTVSETADWIEESAWLKKRMEFIGDE